MTAIKAAELRDMDDGELRKRVAELRREVFGLRFANATGELDDTSGLGRARRDLARALTVARERTLTVHGNSELTENGQNG
ncbi:MAG TPA: 50S ribosomal protein L29 [Solirubrobacteraceae bacterium]|nr:50S ribosomal protein L29 [Solirubrobacteraceae bacterium]